MESNNSNKNDHEAYRFKLVKERIQPEVLISESSGNIITSAGNITVITGPPKSGKTAIAGAILAANVSDNPSTDTLGMHVGRNGARQGIVYINTELSNPDFYRFNQNVMLRASIEELPEFYRAYNFNSFSVSELKEATRAVIKKTYDETGLRLIVIDGIADYVRSVNHEEDCNEIIREFSEVARKLNVGVILITHNNPGPDGKSRGHLGSHLARKGETVLDVCFKGGFSILTAKFTRNGAAFDPICFRYDPKLGYHVFCARESGLNSVKKIDKELRSEIKEKSFLSQFYHETNTIPCEDFIQIIMREFRSKDRSAKNYVRKWKEKGWLATTPKGYRIMVKS